MILTAAPMEANLTLNSRTYAKPSLSERWTPAETAKFYKVGTAWSARPLSDILACPAISTLLMFIVHALVR